MQRHHFCNYFLCRSCLLSSFTSVACSHRVQNCVSCIIPQSWSKDEKSTPAPLQLLNNGRRTMTGVMQLVKILFWDWTITLGYGIINGNLILRIKLTWNLLGLRNWSISGVLFFVSVQKILVSIISFIW